MFDKKAGEGEGKGDKMFKSQAFGKSCCRIETPRAPARRRRLTRPPFVEERVKQFQKVMETHPNKVPVILEKAPTAEVPDVDRNKYLLPREFTVANFLDVIRKRTNLGKEQAIFVYVNGSVPASNAMFGSIYEQHKDADGFLYIVYTGESSFGSPALSS